MGQHHNTPFVFLFLRYCLSRWTPQVDLRKRWTVVKADSGQKWSRQRDVTSKAQKVVSVEGQAAIQWLDN